jgi:hypothetical protein
MLNAAEMRRVVLLTAIQMSNIVSVLLWRFERTVVDTLATFVLTAHMDNPRKS